MSNQPEEEEIGIPEWVVTFGDMMSLLLTFFIMLVSMSEIKEEERFQALVDSMQKRFGYDSAQVSLEPEQFTPRKSMLKKTSSLGRSKISKNKDGGAKQKLPPGEQRKVKMIRSGKQRSVGGVIYFGETVWEMTDTEKRYLNTIAQQIAGKSHKVEVRGHTSMRPVGNADSKGDAWKPRDNWDLAYSRCRTVANYLIKRGVKSYRIRMAVAADNEPAHTGIDMEKLKQNSRVEVFMLDERVSNRKDNSKQEGQTHG